MLRRVMRRPIDAGFDGRKGERCRAAQREEMVAEVISGDGNKMSMGVPGFAPDDDCRHATADSAVRAAVQ